MKIIFLCGSLEPGRDGVGDYTRRLGIEMMKQGHEIAAIALNDWHVTNEFEDEQHSEDNCLRVLRLPSVWTSKQRFGRAKNFVDLFDPDWISLQFVNFAFDLKGLHFGLGKSLAQIGIGRKWHIMFHELWVGMAVGAKIKHVIWGKLQRFLIKDLIQKIKPLFIHTQSRLYKIQLVRLGFKVDYLPLFSNIPRSIENLRKKAVPYNSSKTVLDISFVVFGTIHPSSPVEAFAKEAADYAKKNKLNIKVVFIGRNGTELERWIKVLESEKLSVELLGEQPPEVISKVLSAASMGISTSSIAYIEKSGSVVAMIEHGLPVLCIAKSKQLIDMQYVAPPYGILEYKMGNLNDCLKLQFELPEVDLVLSVSKIMEETFSNYKIEVS